MRHGDKRRSVDAKYNATAGVWRVAGLSTWTAVTISGGSTIVIEDTVHGGCLDWVNGTGITDGACDLARSNWIVDSNCTAGNTLTNAYAKSLGDDDVL